MAKDKELRLRRSKNQDQDARAKQTSKQKGDTCTNKGPTFFRDYFFQELSIKGRTFQYKIDYSTIQPINESTPPKRPLNHLLPIAFLAIH